MYKCNYQSLANIDGSSSISMRHKKTRWMHVVFVIRSILTEYTFELKYLEHKEYLLFVDFFSVKFNQIKKSRADEMAYNEEYNPFADSSIQQATAQSL